MALKSRKKEISNISNDEAEKLAKELADKPYGSEPEKNTNDELVRTSITLPQSMLNHIEDIAYQNKRAGVEPKTVSALIRQAVISYT